MSFARIIMASLTATLVGCATVNVGDPRVEARLKMFEPASDLVSVYVCREIGFSGAGIRTTVYVNDKSIGALKIGMFGHALVKPGKIEVFLERDGLIGGSSGTLVLEGKPGDIKYVWVGMTGFGLGVLTVDNFPNSKVARECVKESTYATASQADA